MFRNKEFRDFYINSGGSSLSANSYVSNLNKINAALIGNNWNGLDEAITSRGADAIIDWAKSTSSHPFDKYPSDLRSSLKKYIDFYQKAQSLNQEINTVLDEPVPDVGSIFQLEKEMQHSVRKQLGRLEAGLVAVDNGIEYVVSTGRIDILAKDANGKHVIIELKAGICPSGALEQALGYAQDVLNEVDDASDVRVFIIASEFKPRILAAAKLIPVIQLRKYEFSLSFNEV